MAEPGSSVAQRLAILEEALRFAHVGLYRYRFDGTVLDMNQPAFEIMGLDAKYSSPSQVIGRNIEDLIIYVGPRGRLRRLIRAQGEARNVLYPFRTLAGEERFALHNSFLMADPATGEQVIQAIIRDVTEAHQRDEALRASEQRLASIVETVAAGIGIVDRSGRITFANAASERILGLSRQVITQRTFDDPAWKLTTVDGQPLSAEELPFQRLITTGEPVSDMQYGVQRADGVRIILSINAAPLRDPAGEIVGIVVSLSDITEQKRLERLRDEFLATAAHELKTPVATIKGYAQLLAQWAPGGHEPREGMAFDIINRQSDRISRLVQGLLEFSRLQRGPIELRRQRFDLGDLAAEVVARVQPTAAAHQLILQREARAVVDADRDRIDQVLFNLVDNGIKASPRGGRIEIVVSARGGEAVASVRDYGVGIPPERQSRVFERFYQPLAGTPYHFGGLGMGLYLSREIITRHGGGMWFESVWGQGSTFYLSLPLAEGGGGGRQG